MNDIPNSGTAHEALLSLVRPGLLAGFWFALWAGLLLWASYALATAWPYVGLMPQWLLLLTISLPAPAS